MVGSSDKVHVDFKANVKIQSNLEYIRVAIVLAPLLGLLGTILGMIEVFHILAVTGGGDAGNGWRCG